MRGNRLSQSQFVLSMSFLKTLLYFASTLTLCTQTHGQVLEAEQKADSILLDYGFVVKPLAVQTLSDGRTLSDISGYFIGSNLYADSIGYDFLKHHADAQASLAQSMLLFQSSMVDMGDKLGMPVGHYDFDRNQNRDLISLNYYRPYPGHHDSTLIVPLKESGLDIAAFNQHEAHIYDRVPFRHKIIREIIIATLPRDSLRRTTGDSVPPAPHPAFHPVSDPNPKP